MGNSTYSTGFEEVYDYWVLGPLGIAKTVGMKQDPLEKKGHPVLMLYAESGLGLTAEEP